MKWSYLAFGLFFLTVTLAEAADAEFPFTPPSNFTIRPDLIVVHHPVTTRHSAAQLYFDQGLTLIYAFNHDAAYWSFMRASEVDPQMAMAYWGMALALGPNINRKSSSKEAKVAYEAIQKASQLAFQASESERGYITALSKRYSADAKPDFKKLGKAYADDMKELHKKYPDDPDAAVLYADSLINLSPWEQWDSKGKPKPATEDAIKSLESVLKSDPKHLGANHYYIHLIEASRHPEYALMPAERLKKLLPASGHILHMPSHIYLRVGNYHEAAVANEEAVAADYHYIQEYGIQGIYPVHYQSHNLYFLSYAYSMEGRYEDAVKTAKELEKFYLPHAKQMAELEYYAPTPMFVLLRFHHWQDILQLPEPEENLAVARVLWHFGRAMAYIGLGDLKNAGLEKKLFLEGSAALPKDKDKEKKYGYNKAAAVLKIPEYLIEAKLAEVHEQDNDTIAFLEQAVKAQDELKYNEPPDWFFPVRESLGGTLLRFNRYKEAEKVFREDLAQHPRNGRSLFGLRYSLEAQSRESDVYWVNQEFEKAWMYSDYPLTINEL